MKKSQKLCFLNTNGLLSWSPHTKSLFGSAVEPGFDRI